MNFLEELEAAVPELVEFLRARPGDRVVRLTMRKDGNLDVRLVGHLGHPEKGALEAGFHVPFSHISSSEMIRIAMETLLMKDGRQL